MSSASVLFVLEKVLWKRAQPGDEGLLCSFGAGFTAPAPVE